MMDSPSLVHLRSPTVINPLFLVDLPLSLVILSLVMADIMLLLDLLHKVVDTTLRLDLLHSVVDIMLRLDHRLHTVGIPLLPDLLHTVDMEDFLILVILSVLKKTRAGMGSLQLIRILKVRHRKNSRVVILLLIRMEVVVPGGKS